MNILIIGNGFDLAHKLPTKYTDFLDFLGNVRVLKEIHPEERKRLIRKIDKDMKQYLFTDENNFNINSKRSEYIDEIYQLSKDNIWINWLYQRRADNEILGEYWVDFETEISGVIQSIEQLSPILSESSGVFNLIGIQAKVFTFFIKKYYTEHKSQDATMKYLKERLLLDLNKLIRCFEIYLEDFVKNINKRLLSLDIYNLKVDKVLTFNYTNTYLKLYNDDVECDYIHGKSDINNTMVTNNMVLGINDYLKESERFTNTQFIEFKKYYQRLIKLTNSHYKKWLDEINNKNQNVIHNVYIFGHSLADTDHDILREFINNPKLKITIFYNNSNQYSSQICNLVHLIGPDKLNEWVYQARPKIQFIKQNSMINIDDSEWRIMRDIKECTELAKLSIDKIENKIDQIRKHIQQKDYTYFRNQTNVVNLIVSIVTSGYIDDLLISQMLIIAQDLYDRTQDEKYYTEQFKKYDNAIPMYKKIISSFIHEINQFNYSKKKEYYTTLDINSYDKMLTCLDTGVVIDKNEILFLIYEIIQRAEQTSELNEKKWTCIIRLVHRLNAEDILSSINYYIYESNSDNSLRIRYTYLLNLLKQLDFFDDDLLDKYQLK